MALVPIAKKATGRDLVRWGAALGGGTAAGAGTSYAVTRDKRKSAGVAAGGLAAQGLYQGAGYATTHYIRGRTGQNLKRTDLTGIKAGTQPRGMLRADLADKKGWEARMNTRRKHIASHTTGGKTNWPKAYRSWPKEMPYARGSRTIGHTHTGRRGMVVGAGATALGALGGARAARRREVGKALLYERDKNTSLLRAAGTTAGLGLAAWGLPRHKFLGPALARGVKAATKHESAAALEALQLAERAAGTLRGVTGQAERRLRTIAHVDAAINRVPRAIRPEVATAAGLILVGHSHPVRRERYTPVIVGGGY